MAFILLAVQESTLICSLRRSAFPLLLYGVILFALKTFSIERSACARGDWHFFTLCGVWAKNLKATHEEMRKLAVWARARGEKLVVLAERVQGLARIGC